MSRQGFLTTLCVLSLLFLADMSAAKSPDLRSLNLPQFAPDRVLVKFLPGTAASEIGEAHRRANGLILKTIPVIGVQVVQVHSGSVQAKVAAYQANPNVLYAEPDYYRLLVVPDEEDGPTPAGGADYFTEQWYLHNEAQPHSYIRQTIFGPSLNTTRGTADADINAPQGWDISQGVIATDPTSYDAPKVAVLDSGADCTSLELSGKCLEQVNLVGDSLLDSCQGSGVACDNLGHGTFTAGEIVANTDNDKGIAGVGWNTGAGIFKVCYAELITDGANLFIVGLCPVSASAEAIVTAASDQYDANNTLIRSQYHVITMSYGSDYIGEDGSITPTSPSSAECAAVLEAWQKGVVVVAAAGNNGNTQRVYPAACTVEDGDPQQAGNVQSTVIAVAASDDSDNKASFSTYSDSSDPWVAMAAPGEAIIGIQPDVLCGIAPGSDTCVDWWNGTSMAAPLVAGSAALVWSNLYETLQLASSAADCMFNGQQCNQEVRNRLENSAAKVGAKNQDLLQWTRHGRLDLAAALAGPSNSDPVASFGYSCTDTSCLFDSSNSSDSDGSINSWSWEFGDNNSSTLANPNHTYTSAGSYIVTLTVTDNGGASNNTSQSLTLIDSQNTAPTASFSATPLDLTVVFTDTSSDSDGAIVSWLWDFGGGNTSTDQNPSHTYPSANTYSVSLTVIDNDGASSNVSNWITVTDPVQQPLAAPSNLVADEQTTGKGKKKVVSAASLSWVDNSANEDGFVVERCEEITSGRGKNRTVTCNYVEHVRVFDLSVNLDPETDLGYRYRVRAFRVAESSVVEFSDPSNEVEI